MKKHKQTSAQRMADKALKDLQKAINDASYVLFPTLALALNEIYGWKRDHIERVFKVCQQTWNECIETDDASMLEMCCNETGISCTNESLQDFEEVNYLSKKKWEETRKKLRFKTRDQEYIYLACVRRKEIPWMEAVVTSGMFLALHRREGFGFERCAKVYETMRRIKLENNNNSDILCKLCENKLHMNLVTSNGLFYFELKEG